MVQMFSLINILNCLPPLIFVLKHICTRLTILTSSKNNDKIKVAETFVVASWQSAYTPWTANIVFYHFRNADCIDYLYVEGQGEGEVLKRRVQE